MSWNFPAWLLPDSSLELKIGSGALQSIGRSLHPPGDCVRAVLASSALNCNFSLCLSFYFNSQYSLERDFTHFSFVNPRLLWKMRKNSGRPVQRRVSVELIAGLTSPPSRGGRWQAAGSTSSPGGGSGRSTGCRKQRPSVLLM